MTTDAHPSSIPPTSAASCHADALDRLRDPRHLEARVPGITSVLAVLRLILAGHCRPLPGFWHTPLTKIAVLVHAAVSHPVGLGVTHRALWEMGLRAAASAMTGRDFDIAADRLGVRRRLAQRPHGTWTREFALERYAALVRSAGTTLTSRMLMDKGGDARMVHLAAHRSQGGWSSFVADVARRYPDLPMPGSPIASDGTRLDSQQEVVVYEAIRRAFPETGIALQARLVRKTGRPYVSDLLIGGLVHVEVMGVGLDDKGTDTYRASCRKRFERKLAHYRDVVGSTPVIIEPLDVADPSRLQAKVRDVADRLGTATVPPTSPGSPRHVLGTWQDDALCERELRRLAGAHGRWPTVAEIAAAGCCGLSTWVRSQGGPRAVAGRLGLRYVRQPAASRRRDVRRRASLARLVDHARSTGRLPRASRRRGQGDALGDAVTRLGGVRQALQLVSGQLGQPVAASRHPAGHWDAPEAVAGVARVLVERLGRMPLLAELVAEAGSTTIAVAVARQGGIHALRDRLGTAATTARRPPGHWKRRDVLVALARDVAGRTGGVTLKAMCAHAGTSSVGHGVRAVGGLPVVLRWLEEANALASSTPTHADVPD